MDDLMGLTESVIAAVRAAILALQASRPGESLAGFALLTDDNLRTLGHAMCTSEWLARDGNMDARFEPVDWPYADGAEAFDDARRILVQLAESADNMMRHVDGSYEALVVALAQARTEGTLGQDVFCSVISTDPNEYLESLEDRAVLRLNGAAVHKARRDLLDRWS